MATWAEFAAAEPEMARRGSEQLSIPVAYLATVRKDGSPRLHPLSPMFADGRLFVAIQATAPRRYDLTNDRRYSLHALPPMLGPDYDEFEFNVAGRARLATEPAIREAVNASERARSRPNIEDEAWMFELDIEMALTTVWNHKMAQADGRWIPTLDEMPTATHKVWRA
jgi:hypothetical protein